MWQHPHNPPQLPWPPTGQREDSWGRTWSSSSMLFCAPHHPLPPTRLMPSSSPAQCSRQTACYRAWSPLPSILPSLLPNLHPHHVSMSVNCIVCGSFGVPGLEYVLWSATDCAWPGGLGLGDTSKTWCETLSQVCSQTCYPGGQASAAAACRSMPQHAAACRSMPQHAAAPVFWSCTRGF